MAHLEISRASYEFEYDREFQCLILRLDSKVFKDIIDSSDWVTLRGSKTSALYAMSKFPKGNLSIQSIMELKLFKCEPTSELYVAQFIFKDNTYQVLIKGVDKLNTWVQIKSKNLMYD